MLETMIGVDLAKSVFQVHGASMTGVVRFHKRFDQKPVPPVSYSRAQNRFCDGSVAEARITGRARWSR